MAGKGPAGLLASLCIVTTLPLSNSGHGQQWHTPHPWRAEAVLDGRRQDYNHERFMHAFSYRHLSPSPAEWQDGIRGSGGSLSSNTLLFDFNYKQGFAFANPDTEFSLDIQRSEDFDGAYDRQLVGFRHTLDERDWLPGHGRWQLSLQGDVFADKSRSDIYFGSRYLRPEGGWLQLSLILPDAYFNDKTDDDSRFIGNPYTLFMQWQQPHGDNGNTTFSVSHSPRSQLDSRSAAVRVSSEQSRAALHHRQRYGHWQGQFDLEGELSRRQQRLDESVTALPFQRDMAAITLAGQHLGHDLQPQLGLRYFWLREQGWFGRRLNAAGQLERREPLLFGSVQLQLNEQQWLSPTIYLSRPRVHQQVDSPLWDVKDSDHWIGKLSIPWHWRIQPRQQAILTVVPSFRLHRAAFGGGNVQLHWPL